MNSLINLLFILIIIHHTSNINANRDFINGTNYKCNDDGIVIELPNHLRKPCMLCTCSKGLVICEKLKPCSNNYKPDRRKRSVRCIEEECCNLVDMFLNNNEDGRTRSAGYRNVDESTNEINNQIRTSTIRYVHCPNNMLRNNQFNELSNSNSELITRLTKTSINPLIRSTINTRSVTTNPNLNRQRDGLCTLSHSLNSETHKHRQYLTTFDGMKMRLKTNNNCHFVFARDCEGEDFSIHLQYSNHPFSNSSSKSVHNINRIDLNKFDDLDNNLDEHDNLNLLDGKTTSNYTQRYLTSLQQNKILSKERLSLFVRIDRRKIRLDSNLSVKLDNRSILLPYLHRGVRIMNYQNYIIIRTDIGLRIIWSGQEVVVSLPKHFQQRICGLCGNFNDDLTDDLKNRKGHLLQSQFRFFQSWTTGKNRQCMISNNKHHKQNKTEDKLEDAIENYHQTNTHSNTCKYTFRKKMRATKFCNSLKTNIPIECFKNLGIADNYYEDCLDKMCPCNTKACYCDVLSSYVDKCSKVLTNANQFNMTIFQTECQNFNEYSSSHANNLNQSRIARTLELLKSDKHFNLDEMSSKICPEGSVYSDCAPIERYRVTCSDLLPKTEFNNNRLPEQPDVCKAGCKCEKSKVWSNNYSKCISIDDCSSLSLSLRKRTAAFNSIGSLINRPRLTLN